MQTQTVIYECQCDTNKCIWTFRGQHGPIWGRQSPGGPHAGSMNYVIWDTIREYTLPPHENWFREVSKGSKPPPDGVGIFV